jgi:hypothetical protein
MRGLAHIGLVASVLGISLASPVLAHELDERLGGELAPMLAALARGDHAEVARWGRHGHARWEGPLLQVQLHVAPGVDPEAIPDAVLQAWGGRAGDRGLDVLDAWLPPSQIAAFLQANPQIVAARLCDRPVPMAGKALSEGAAKLRTPEVACLGADATGVTVAVVDSGFEKFTASVEAGEVPKVVGKVAEVEGTHGTMCAQTVADVAPAATIYPVRISTLASIQKFVKELTQKGNPNKVQVVSHSVGWFGMSFGRHEGPLCAVTDLARSVGVAWVNAAGNNGDGHFYQGTWTDANKDGWHEFAPGVDQLNFIAYGVVELNVDWDDYAARKTDLDIVLLKATKDGWVEIDESNIKQGPNSPPIEQVNVEAGGPCALRIRCAKNCSPGLRLRAVNLKGGGPFSVSMRNGNVYDPGSCKGVLTVGAVHHSAIESGPLEGFSSYGPTVDGRMKPEVVAADGTATSDGVFFGTSSACPHAAGVVALYVGRGWTPLEAIGQVQKDALPLGVGHPNPAYGWGRVHPGPASLGWQCDAAQPAKDATCTTACGSIGVRQCGASCQFTACTPPASDACNGQDDDCDGSTDEGFACALGSEATCVGDCGSVGTRSCGSGCQWTACVSPPGACGVDGGSADGVGADTSTAVRGAVVGGGGCCAGAASGGGAWLWLAVGGLWGWRRRAVASPKARALLP